MARAAAAAIRRRVHRGSITAATVAGLALGALVPSGCGGAGSSGPAPDAVVAIQGAQITPAQVQHWLTIAALSNAKGVFARGAVAPDPPLYSACIHHIEEVGRVLSPGHHASRTALRGACESQYTTLRERALSFLITAQWALAEGRALGVGPSPAQVEAQLQKLRAARFPTPALERRVLGATGETLADLAFEIRLELVNEAISRHAAASSSEVNGSQVAAYYSGHRAAFGARETRDVQLILTASAAAARAARREIEAGRSFATVADASTIEAVGKRSGGLFTGVEPGERTPPLDRAIFHATPGELSGPVKTVVGYYLYEVTAVHHVPARTLREATPTIGRVIGRPREELALRAFAKQFEARWRSRTRCRAGWVVAQCGARLTG